jgi:hypothetical protein
MKGTSGCHVIQRELLQPLPAIWHTFSPRRRRRTGRLRPPDGPFCSPRPLPSDREAG